MESVNDVAKPPLTTTTSILPAAIVLGIAVAVLGIFLGVNLLANPSVRPTPTTIPIVVGGLASAPTNGLLAGCHQAGSPPANIASALLVPVDSTATQSTKHPNGGAGDYDCYRALVTKAPSSQLLGFYSAHLQALGWTLFSRGSSTGKPQLLFQKAGSDTFYWVVGITIDSQIGGDAKWTYRIYQNSSAI
jgi:hypothetical protein